MPHTADQHAQTHERTHPHSLFHCPATAGLSPNAALASLPCKQTQALSVCGSVHLSYTLSLRLPLLTLFCPFIPPPSQPAASSPPSVHAVETCRAEQLVNVPCTPRVTLAQQTQIGSRLSASPALCVRPQRGHWLSLLGSRPGGRTASVLGTGHYWTAPFQHIHSTVAASPLCRVSVKHLSITTREDPDEKDNILMISHCLFWSLHRLGFPLNQGLKQTLLSILMELHTDYTVEMAFSGLYAQTHPAAVFLSTLWLHIPTVTLVRWRLNHFYYCLHSKKHRSGWW